MNSSFWDWQWQTNNKSELSTSYDIDDIINCGYSDTLHSLIIEETQKVHLTKAFQDIMMQLLTIAYVSTDAWETYGIKFVCSRIECFILV